MAKVSKSGYKRNSKDKNEPALVIPSNNITMKGVDFPVYGIDNTGYTQMMYPGGEYQFPGNMVYEIPMAQDGMEMPFGLPLRSTNPSAPYAYESPVANGYLLPDPNRPELLNTGATEYKMGVDNAVIPTVVNGNYMSPDDAYARYLITGEQFIPTANPESYSRFYDTISQLGLMKQQRGGDPSIPDLSQRGWLDKYQDGKQVKKESYRTQWWDPNDPTKWNEAWMSDPIRRQAQAEFPNSYTLPTIEISAELTPEQRRKKEEEEISRKAAVPKSRYMIIPSTDASDSTYEKTLALYDQFMADNYWKSKSGRGKKKYPFESTNDTIINLTNKPMGWFGFNEIPEEQYTDILGNNYVEAKSNAQGVDFGTGRPEDTAANWMERMKNADDTFRNKTKGIKSYYHSKDIPAFYGIENKRIKVGRAEDFQDNTIIVPVRNSTTPYAKVDKEKGLISDTYYTYDNEGNKIWNLNNKHKFLAHSPQTGQTIFLANDDNPEFLKAGLEEFQKTNPGAYIISLDEGRFESHMNDPKGLSETAFKKWTGNSYSGNSIYHDFLTGRSSWLFDRNNMDIPIDNDTNPNNYGYNIGILKQKHGGSHNWLDRYQKGEQVRTKTYIDPEEFRIANQAYQDSLVLVEGPTEAYRRSLIINNLIQNNNFQRAQQLLNSDYIMPERAVIAFKNLTERNNQKPKPIRGSEYLWGLSPNDPGFPIYKKPTEKPVLQERPTAPEPLKYKEARLEPTVPGLQPSTVVPQVYREPIPIMRAAQDTHTGQYQVGSYYWDPVNKQWKQKLYSPETQQENYNEVKIHKRKKIKAPTFQTGGWLNKYQGDKEPSQVERRDPNLPFYETETPGLYQTQYAQPEVTITPNWTEAELERNRLRDKYIKDDKKAFRHWYDKLGYDRDNVEGRALQHAYNKLAKDYLKGDRDQLTPEQIKFIQKSEYASRLDPTIGSRFARGLKSVSPAAWLANQENIPSSPLQVIADLAAPFEYPSNLIRGAVKGEFGDAVSGYTPSPYFVSSDLAGTSPTEAAIMSGVMTAGTDPLFLTGDEIARGIGQGAKTASKYVNNQYINIAEGSNPFNRAWRSPAARFDPNAVRPYTTLEGQFMAEVPTIQMPLSKEHFEKIKNLTDLTDEENYFLKQYEYASEPFTGRRRVEIDPIKRAKLDALLKRAEVVIDEPLVMTRRINTENPELYNTVDGVYTPGRPTSWSAGRDAVGNHEYSGSADRLVLKLPKGKHKLLKNPYQSLTEEQLAKYAEELKEKLPLASPDDIQDKVNSLNRNRLKERELVLGSDAQLKQIGKVKNKFGGYDHIVKLKKTKTKLNWNEATEQYLKKEYDIEIRKKGLDDLISEDEFIRQAKQQNVKAIKNASNLQYRTINPTRQSIIDQSKNYASWPKYRNEQTIDDIYKGFETGKLMDPIIVMEMPNGSRRIVSGNTRLNIAEQLGIEPMGITITPKPKTLPGSANVDTNNSIIAKFTNDVSNVENLSGLEGEKAIEAIRKRKLESWKTEEGRKRLQKLIYNTPGLENETPDTFIKRMESAENMAMTRRNAKTKLVEIENQINAYFTELNDLDKLLDENKITTSNHTAAKSDIENKLAVLGDLYDEQKLKSDFHGLNAAYVTYPTSSVPEIYLDDYAYSTADLPYLAAHEVSGHSLNILPGKTNPTYLDNELAKLKLIDNVSETQETNLPKQGISKFYHRHGEGSKNYLKNAIEYFLTGTKGAEKVPFLTEVKEDMLLKGIIKNDYDEITPEMIEAHYKSYKKDPGEKFSLRLYDITQEDKDNFKLISKVLNDLPSWAAPVILGTGAYMLSQPKKIESPEFKKGGWLDNYK